MRAFQSTLARLPAHITGTILLRRPGRPMWTPLRDVTADPPAPQRGYLPRTPTTRCVGAWPSHLMDIGKASHFRRTRFARSRSGCASHGEPRSGRSVCSDVAGFARNFVLRPPNRRSMAFVGASRPAHAAVFARFGLQRQAATFKPAAERRSTVTRPAAGVGSLPRHRRTGVTNST